MSLDGPISIVIGPNGGGKTNLLDTLVIMLRKHLFSSMYLEQHDDGVQTRWNYRKNDNINSMVFEKHSAGRELPQYVSVEIEVSQSDLDNMETIKKEAPIVKKGVSRIFLNDPWEPVTSWTTTALKAGERIKVEWVNGQVQTLGNPAHKQFLQYIQLYEFHNQMSAEAGMGLLRLSMVYLPVNRAANGFQSAVGLAGYNDNDHKRSVDATHSRNSPSIVQLAVGRLAQRYRRLLEDSNTEARKVFYEDANLKALTADLNALGYEWELTTVNPMTNEYDITLKKQGTPYLVGAASSGEREILTYLFVVYALNVRDAVIIVDEPELHLHPRWQMVLLQLFEKLSSKTGNQFVMATHSPTFISPASIQYVSRVYIENQRSNIVRLNSAALPERKHLFNVVNTQNNERLFFADKVLLVEGLHDKIFFERVLEEVGLQHGAPPERALEIISVGGKGLFAAYKQILEACHVQYALIADRDYIEQIGTGEIKELFRVNATEIKEDVIDNIKSLDGATLVARIDEAMASGIWDDAQNVWSYIKSRRVELKPHLTDDESRKLNSFIALKAQSEAVHLLKRGTLEAYLPDGYRSKDTDKLIRFVSSNTFWADLPELPRQELEEIAKSVLGVLH